MASLISWAKDGEVGLRTVYKRKEEGASHSEMGRGNFNGSGIKRNIKYHKYYRLYKRKDYPSSPSELGRENLVEATYKRKEE